MLNKDCQFAQDDSWSSDLQWISMCSCSGAHRYLESFGLLEETMLLTAFCVWLTSSSFSSTCIEVPNLAVKVNLGTIKDTLQCSGYLFTHPESRDRDVPVIE